MSVPTQASNVTIDSAYTNSPDLNIFVITSVDWKSLTIVQSFQSRTMSITNATANISSLNTNVIINTPTVINISSLAGDTIVVKLGTTIIYSFTYTYASPLSSMVDAFGYIGSLATNSWTTYAAGTPTLSAGGESLVYPGLPASTGANRVLITNVGEDVVKPFPLIRPNGIVNKGYYSAMIKPSAAQATGDYFMCFSNISSFTIGTANQLGRLYIKIGSSPSKYKVGISLGSTGIIYSTNEFDINVTAFIVGMISTDSTSQSKAVVFVNPIPGLSEPAATVSTVLSTATVGTLYGIILRQGAISGAPTLELDDVRVGSTWESVTPSSSQITVTVPDAPTIGTAVLGSNSGEVKVYFTAPTNTGGATITNYTVIPSIGIAQTATASPYTFTGLTNGTSYSFTVKANNSAGQSNPSSISNSVTTPTSPDAPTGVTATAYDGRVSVAFTPPANNGGAAITGYTVTTYTDIIFVKYVLVNSPATSVVVTGLTNGTSYTFIVKANNIVGSSTDSAAVSVTTPTSPDAPTGVTAVRGNSGEAIVSFTAPSSNGGATITEYIASSNPVGFSKSGTTVSPLTVTGLTNGISYTFTVVAKNSAGLSSAASGSSNSVIPLNASAASLQTLKGISDVGISAIMTTLLAAPIVNGSVVDIVALGMPHPNTGVDLDEKKRINKQIINTIFENKPLLTSFKVKSSDLAIAAENVKENLIIVKNVANSTSSPFVLDGIMNSTTGVYAALENVGDINKFSFGSKTYTIVKTADGYTFTDSVGSSQTCVEGQKLEFDRLVLIFGGSSLTQKDLPDPPTGVTAIAGNGSVNVYFTAPTYIGTSPITEYTVISSSGTVQTATLSPYTFTGLTNGTEYTFTVKAINSSGPSDASGVSNLVTPTTVTDAPTGVTASRNNNGEIFVYFTAPTNTGGSAITNYTVTSSNGIGRTATESPYKFTGLPPGTLVTFTVRANNSAGPSAASGISNQVTTPAYPDAPTDVTATAYDGRVSVAFTPPANNGGADITGYSVLYNSVNTPTEVFGSSSPIEITGLTNGTQYAFSVFARNMVGPSTASASVLVTSLGLGDYNPFSITGDAASGWNTDINMTYADGIWSLSSQTLSAGSIRFKGVSGSITNYYGSTQFPIGTLALNGSNIQVTAGTYDITVNTDKSFSFTPVTDPNAYLQDIFTVSAVADSPTQATVTFNGMSNLNIVSYTVSGTNLTSVDIDVNSPLQATFINLTPGASYTFSVVANTSSLSSVPNNVTLIMPPSEDNSNPPGKPILSVTANSSTQVTLNIQAGIGGSVDYYNLTIYSTTDSAIPAYDGNSFSNGSIISNFQAGGTYTFSVFAYNNVDGQSPNSDPFTLIMPTVANAPTITSITPTTNSATVNFSAPTNTGGSAILSYTVSSAGLTDIIVSASASPLQALFTGLSEDTEYTFTVIAINSVGPSDPSNPSGVRTTKTQASITKPSVPLIYSVENTGSNFKLTFTTPTTDGGAPIESYTLTTTKGTEPSITTSNVVVTPINYGGFILIPFTTSSTEITYKFELQAYNGTEFSDKSTINIIVDATPLLPSVTISADKTTINSGESVTFTSTLINAGEIIPTYQWYIGSTSVGLDSATFTTTSLADGDSVSVILSVQDGPSITSNTLTITVTAPLVPSVSIAADKTTINSGQSVTFTATPINGGLTPVYYWYNNGTYIAGQTNTAIFTTTSLADGTVYAVLSSYGQLSQSNNVTITVNSGEQSTGSAGSSGSVNKAIEVNFAVDVDANGEIQILGASALSLTNVIDAAVKLPVSALYTATNSMFEFWEPLDDPLTGGVNERGLIYAELAETAPRNYKLLTHALENGVYDCLTGEIDGSLAAPFNLPAYASNIEYRKASSFGELALKTVAHHIMGHVAGTSSITNDKAFIDGMNSSTFSKYVGTALTASDDYTASISPSASDAMLAKALVKAIATKSDDDVALIARQVIGQDASRAMDQDNNKLLPVVHHALKFIAGDIIYVNIKLQQPTITIGAGQLVSKSTLNAKFPAVSNTTTNYTVKITLV